jgi:hypothetical protein
MIYLDFGQFAGKMAESKKNSMVFLKKRHKTGSGMG